MVPDNGAEAAEFRVLHRDLVQRNPASGCSPAVHEHSQRHLVALLPSLTHAE